MSLLFAAETNTMMPAADSEGQALTFGKVEKILTPLKTTVMLLQDKETKVCLVTSHWLGVHYYCYSNFIRRSLSEKLGIPFENVLVFGSHNHTAAALNKNSRIMGKQERYSFRPDDDLTGDGQKLLSAVEAIAERLPARLEEVTIQWGLGHEGRITHQNKGRRADGSTFMIREEDRLQLRLDFRGIIETHAPIVAFVGRNGKPRAFLTQFTGHPVTVYHPDHAVVHGEYPQIACDDLSDAFGGVPVGFMQGCAADSHSLHSFTGRPIEEIVPLAERNGHLLGATFIEAAKNLHPSSHQDLSIAWQDVKLPFCQLPPPENLRQAIADIDAYTRRLDKGDQDTRVCAGLNFASSFSLKHRKALVEPVRRWAKWVLAFHEENRVDEAPTHIVTPVLALRIGDIGIAGFTCEPFQNIGRRTRALSSLPLTIPCGYLNDTSVVNIPDADNNGDMDFMSSTYRYTLNMLQYAQPAGDLLAYASADMLNRSVSHETTGSEAGIVRPGISVDEL